MQVGLRLPQTGRGHATKENIILLAKQAENANFLSLWVLEKLLCLLTHKTLIQELKMASFLMIGSTYLIPLRYLSLYLHIQTRLC